MNFRMPSFKVAYNSGTVMSLLYGSQKAARNFCENPKCVAVIDSGSTFISVGHTYWPAVKKMILTAKNGCTGTDFYGYPPPQTHAH